MINPYRYNAPAHWNDISKAPRDGTVIEIQNNYGVAPHFALCHWNDDQDKGILGWQKVDDQNSAIG